MWFRETEKSAEKMEESTGKSVIAEKLEVIFEEIGIVPNMGKW